MIRGLVIPGFVLLYLSISQAVAQSPNPDPALVVPNSAILFVKVDSVPELSKAWQGTDLFKLSQTASVHEVFSTLTKQMMVDPEWLGFDVTSLWNAARYWAAYAVLMRTDGTPVYALLLDGHDNVAGFETVFRDLSTALERQGWKRSTDAPSNSSAKMTVFTRNNKEVVFVNWGETYCVLTDKNLAKELITRGSKGTTDQSLAKLPAFETGLQACSLPVQDHIQFYLNPIELGQVFQSDPDDGIDPRVIAQRHGFGAIQAVAGRLAIPADKFDMQFKAAVYAPKPYQQSMKMLDFKDAEALVYPDWAPDYLHTITMLQMDLGNFLECLAGPFNDLATEGTFEEVLEDLQRKDGPGVNLQNDLFAHFSNNIFVIAESNLPVTKTSERSLLCVELKDPAKVAQTIRLLLKDDPNAQSTRIPGQPFELWKYGLTDTDGPSLSSPGLMVANKHLLMASNTEAIRKMVLTLNGQYERLNAAKDVERVLTELKSFAGGSGFMRQITRIDKDVMSAYELLRSGKTQDSEGFYAQLLTRAIQSAKQNGKSLPNFSQLPDFDTIDKNLGIGCGQLQTWTNGWIASGFILRK